MGGGGPAGLIFSITTALRLLNLNKKPNISIFEGRWKAVGADIEWKGAEDGNVRRQQVVTLQVDTVFFLWFYLVRTCHLVLTAHLL